MDEKLLPEKISVSKLLEIYSPFERIIWNGLNTPLTKKETLKAIPIPYDSIYLTVHRLHKRLTTRQIHAGRILWLIQNWEDNNPPIDIDFGIPDLGYPTKELITDGNHRFFAAVIAEKPYIMANCSGQVSYIKHFYYTENEEIHN
jgi:hypothetical protein